LYLCECVLLVQISNWLRTILDKPDRGGLSVKLSRVREVHRNITNCSIPGDAAHGPSIFFCGVSIIDDLIPGPVCIGPLALWDHEILPDSTNGLAGTWRDPINTHFVFNTKPDTGFGDNIGSALASSAAHIAQFLIMWAICSDIDGCMLDDCSVQYQVAVLVRTDRPELLRNDLSVL
jgi:hypothetical protein